MQWQGPEQSDHAPYFLFLPPRACSVVVVPSLFLWCLPPHLLPRLINLRRYFLLKAPTTRGHAVVKSQVRSLCNCKLVYDVRPPQNQRSDGVDSVKQMITKHRKDAHFGWNIGKTQGLGSFPNEPSKGIGVRVQTPMDLLFRGNLSATIPLIKQQYFGKIRRIGTQQNLCNPKRCHIIVVGVASSFVRIFFR